MSAIVAYPNSDTPIARRMIGFVRLLRDNGFPVGLREGRDAARLATEAEIRHDRELRWGLRALLCASRTDWRRFDELFDVYWRLRGMKRVAQVSGDIGRKGLRRLPSGGAPDGPPGPPDRVERGAGNAPADDGGRQDGASAAESLAGTDFVISPIPRLWRRSTI